MTSKLAYAAFVVALWSPALLGAAEDLPSFCASVPVQSAVANTGFICRLYFVDLHCPRATLNSVGN
jgi:hypothetical protein